MIGLLPVQGSSIAPQIDSIFAFVFFATLTLGSVVFVTLVFFCVRYRARAHVNRKVGQINEKIFEATWITVPLILTMVIFGISARAFYHLYVPPREAVDVYVVAKQWMWKFYSPGGVAEIGHLHVPVNKPVRLIMTSEDVIHSFYVADFRVKQDVLPSRYTSLWFTPTQTGQFHVLCTQYCGMNHAAMEAWIDVETPADYAKWYQSRSKQHGQDPAGFEGQGGVIYKRYSCATCHRGREGNATSRVNADGPSGLVAPSLQGLFGHQVLLADGQTVVADADYIRESIYQPNAKVVKGFAPLMPSYAGQISEGEMVELINYIRTMTTQESERAP